MTPHEQLTQRALQILQMGEEILATQQYNFSTESAWVDGAQRQGFRASGLSFIEKTFGKEHSYYTEFEKETHSATESGFKQGLETFRATANEIASGWIGSVKQLVTAEVFTDFLEMAEHLLEQGYKDPAAVMIGSVLEEHLRQLATHHKIALTQVGRDGKESPKKADTLNGELGTQNVYNKLDQKQITAWLDLRNKAAHGHYAEYNAEQVQVMLSGVLEFIRRNGVR